MSESSPPLKLLIADLKYCCPWAFFCAHKRTGLIADRLGVTRRAVQKHKQRFYNGEYKCEEKESCMRAALIRAGKTRDYRLEEK